MAFEQRPVGDGVGAVPHVFGHDVGMRHRASIEMIAREGNRRRQFAVAHHAIDLKAELRALAMAEPGDARRQAFERHMLARKLHPVR